MLKSIDTDIDKVFSRIDNNENVIIKCDIEGSEYDIIDQILKYSEKIDMLIFEFHWIFSPDKSSYVGSYKNDKFHGNGSYSFGDGTKYTGEFKNGLPNGKGTYIYPDGSEYESEFKDGKGLGEKGIYIPTFKEEIFPSYGEGTSMLDLSLSIVTIGSFFLTKSPTFAKISIISTFSKSFKNFK